MTLVIRICVLSVSLWLVGCASTSNLFPTPGVSESLATAEQDYPSQALDLYARELSHLMAEKDIKTLVAEFDEEVFLERVWLQLKQDKKLDSQMRFAARASVQKMTPVPSQIFQGELSEDLYRISLEQVDQVQQQLLYRLEGTEKVSYLKVDYVEVAKGRYKLSDVHGYTFGLSASQYAAYALAVIYAHAEQKVVSKQINQVIQAMGQANGAQWLQAVEQLPPSVQAFEFMRWVRLGAAGAMEDFELTRQAHEQLMAAGVRTDWLGFNIGLSAEDYTFALSMLDSLEGSLIKDAALTNYRAWCLYHLGQTQQAFQLARRSIMLDPEYETGYFFLAEMLMASQQPQAALTTYQLLRQRFGYEFNAEYFISRDYYDALAPLPGFTQLYSP